MNKEININSNKKLVLKNVIKKELRNIDINKIDNEIQKFQTTIMAHNANIFGPLIVRNCGTHIEENGTMSMDIDIMIQANNYKKFSQIFVIEDIHTCSNCVYCRFEGSYDNLQFAYNKLDLFIYENNLEVTGNVYTLYLNNKEKDIIVDIFKQVICV